MPWATFDMTGTSPADVVAAPGVGKRVRVLAVAVTSSGDGLAVFKDDAGNVLLKVALPGGAALPPSRDWDIFAAANKKVTVEGTDAGANVVGGITYSIEPSPS